MLVEFSVFRNKGKERWCEGSRTAAADALLTAWLQGACAVAYPAVHMPTHILEAR
jgi:hypothetical protein